MRTLHFEPNSALYERLYICLMLSPAALAKNELRPFGRLVGALESIGQVRAPTNDDGTPREFIENELRFYVTVQGGDVTIEESQYDLAKKHADASIPTIHKSKARELDALIDYLATVVELAPAALAAGEKPAPALTAGERNGRPI